MNESIDLSEELSGDEDESDELTRRLSIELENSKDDDTRSIDSVNKEVCFFLNIHCIIQFIIFIN